MEITIYILMGLGLFFNLMSVLGLLRFPDLYTRLHASTKCTTFGAIFVTVGVILSCIYKYDSSSITIIVHSFIAVLVIIFTNPIGAHAIARGARRSGVKPYGAVRDDMDEIVPKKYRETEEN